MPDDDVTSKFALLMAVTCVRNTVIEDYHANGQLSDADMMAFNKEVVNKIYTFLTYMLDETKEEYGIFLQTAGWMFPYRWDAPVMDGDFVKAVDMFKERRRLRDKDNP